MLIVKENREQRYAERQETKRSSDAAANRDRNQMPALPSSCKRSQLGKAAFRKRWTYEPQIGCGVIEKTSA